MDHRSVLVASAVFLAAAACSPATENSGAENAGDEGATVTEAEESMTAPDDAAACPVLDSRNWSAWVNAMPGPDAKLTLHVTGEIDLPTPGYEVSWRAGMADRSMTPVQRLMLTLTPPDGMVAQVVTTQTVTYEGPALVRTYGGVIVMCGGETLADIEEVTVAQ